MKYTDIFSKEELGYLSKYKPDLVPMDVPSKNDANLLTKPSVDQIVIEFLKQYEVNVEPRSVGAWNGWDALSTATSLFAREGSTLNIARTMFMANRSNQINSAAQDWATWKRWALDHKNFDQYREGVLQLVDINNQRIIKELDEQIERAEANNKIISAVLMEPDVKEYIDKALKINKEKREKRNTRLGCAILFVPIVIIFCIVVDKSSGGPERRERNRIETLLSDSRQLLDTSSTNPWKAYAETKRIIEELPEEYYLKTSLHGWVIYNYFISAVNLKFIGMDRRRLASSPTSNWCKPEYIFNNLINSSNETEIAPMKQKISNDKAFWIEEMRNICGISKSSSPQTFIKLRSLNSERREKNRIETLLSDARQLVDNYSDDPWKTKIHLKRIIEELPNNFLYEETYEWLIDNYFISDVSTAMIGMNIRWIQSVNSSKWCNPELIINNFLLSRGPVPPLKLKVFTQKNIWMRRIQDICSSAATASYQKYPYSLPESYILKLQKDIDQYKSI